MIVCSCNVVTEREWREAVADIVANCGDTRVKRPANHTVWNAIGKRAACPGCAPTLKQIGHETVAAHNACHAAGLEIK